MSSSVSMKKISADITRQIASLTILSESFEESVDCQSKKEFFLQKKQEFDQFLKELPSWMPIPRVREVWLPIEIAKALLRPDGSLDVTDVEVILNTYCVEGDDVDREIIEGINLLNDPQIKDAIQELPAPFPGTLGDRMVRAMLRLEKDAPLTARHTRIACVASLLTIICQEESLLDCCLISLWGQIKSSSPKLLITDFKEILLFGGIYREVYGVRQFFQSPEEVIPRLRTIKLSSFHSSNVFVKTVAVAASFLEYTPLSSERVREIKRRDAHSTIEELFLKFGNEKSRDLAVLSLEAYTQNVFFQVWNNTVTSLLISSEVPVYPPINLLSKNWPEYVWFSSLLGLVDEKPKKKLFYDAVQEQLRLSVHTYHRDGSLQTLWAVCEKKDEMWVPINELVSVGRILSERLQHVTGRVVTGKEMETAFSQLVLSFLRQVTISGAPLTLQEKPVGWRVIGHSPYALTSRYFSIPTISREAVPCDPERIRSLFGRLQATYKIKKRVEICAVQCGHMFRLILNEKMASLPFEKARKSSTKFLENSCGRTARLSTIIDKLKSVVDSRVSRNLLTVSAAQSVCSRVQEKATSTLPVKSMLHEIRLSLSEVEKAKISCGVLMALLSNRSWNEIEGFEGIRSEFIRSLDRFFTDTVPKNIASEVAKKKWPERTAIADVIDDIKTMVSPYISVRQQDDVRLFFEQKIFSQVELARSFSKKILVSFPADPNYRVFHGQSTVKVGEYFWYNPFFSRWELMTFCGSVCSSSEELIVLGIPPSLVEEIQRTKNCSETEEKR